MDIILVTSSYPLHPDDSEAAAGLFVRDFAAELASQGHSVRILTQRRPGPTDDDPSFQVVRYRWRGHKPLSTLRPGNPSELLSIISVIQNGHTTLDRMIREKRPDLILALWAVPAGLLANRALRKHGVPYRIWVLGSDIWGYGQNPVTRPLVKYVLRGAQRVFADGLKLAEDTASLVGKQVSYLASSRRLPKGHTIPGPLANGKLNFVFIGRFHWNKGPDILVEAINLLNRSEKKRCHFFFFGGGPMEDILRGMIHESGLNEFVSLMGYAEKDTCAAYLEHCHALVIPSRIESIPVILSDAAQMNCPILATDVGDMEELLKTYGGGISVSAEPEKLKEGIKRMIDEGEKVNQDRVDAMMAIFDLETNAKAILTD